MTKYTEFPISLEPYGIYVSSLMQLWVMTLSKDEPMEVILRCGGRSQREVAWAGGHTESIL
jgi:hypothetical protein